MMDEKGRLFGKINIVDLLVILVIIVAAVVLGFAVFSGLFFIRLQRLYRDKHLVAVVRAIKPHKRELAVTAAIFFQRFGHFRARGDDRALLFRREGNFSFLPVPVRADGRFQYQLHEKGTKGQKKHKFSSVASDTDFHSTHTST